MKKRIQFFTAFFLAVIMLAWTVKATAQTPFVRVLQPNHSNIQWALKTRHLISWNDNFTKRVNVYLVDYTTSPHPVYLLAKNVSGSTFSWYINKDVSSHHYTIPTGKYYKIRVSSVVDPTNYKDESDHYFEIAKSAAHTWVRVLQPNHSNIQWALKTRHLISWKDNISGRVNVYLVDYTTSPHPVYLLAKNVSGSTFSWYINKDVSSHHYTIPTGKYYKIRVSSVVDPTKKDESDHYFKIILAPTIDVYPNPSTTHVTLKFNDNDNQNYTLTLYNRYNMRVMLRQVNTTFMKQVRINTFDLPNGIYFLRLTSGKQVISRKIIVQH